MSRTIMVGFAFFVLELWYFDCVFMLFCILYILVHSITHLMFMICNFIGRCIK